MREGVYAPVEPEADGRLPCLVLDLSLRRWEGVYEGEHAVWLRWATADGGTIPTALELAEQAEQAAAGERQRAADLEARVAELERRLAERSGADATGERSGR
ncbi:MAG: hypothetical protein U0531_20395 [Dehalococcoidia bacterium]